LQISHFTSHIISSPKKIKVLHKYIHSHLTTPHYPSHLSSLPLTLPLLSFSPIEINKKIEKQPMHNARNDEQASKKKEMKKKGKFGTITRLGIFSHPSSFPPSLYHSDPPYNLSHNLAVRPLPKIPAVNNIVASFTNHHS
jgi:hypothetical protein